jgi:hypothetical protein
MQDAKSQAIWDKQVFLQAIPDDTSILFNWIYSKAFKQLVGVSLNCSPARRLVFTSRNAKRFNENDCT